MTPTLTSPADASPARPSTRTTGPILVAAKGEGDEAAMRAAHRLAARTGAEVRVVSVVEPEVNFVVPFGAPLAATYERERASVRLRGLEGEMLSVLEERETLWPTEVMVGEPSRVITDAARSMRASLIVMGIGRHDPLGRLFAAETTLATIKRVEAPVLAVAGDFRDLPRTIVAGVDFGEASIHALEVVLELIAPPATIHLVHSWPPAESLHPLLRPRIFDHERVLPERFARLRDALPVPDGVEVRTEWLPGKAAEEITNVAVARRADLIVTGRTVRRGLDRLVAGRTSAAILRSATCSVLVVPEPPARAVERIQREVWGSSESRSPERWAAQLDAFTTRNEGRRTILEVDDPAIGAQTEETGYVLRGATYDHRDARVQLMLGVPDGTTHLTRSIGDVLSVAVMADGVEHGETLRIQYGNGQVLLRAVGEV